MQFGLRTLTGFALACAALAASARAAGDDATLAELSLDASFGTLGGVPEIGRGAMRLDTLQAAAFDAQGRIVVLGSFQRSSTDDFYRGLRPGVARLLADGRLDVKFGRRGVALLPLGGEALGLALDGEGRILVAGTFRRLGAPRSVRTPTFQLARLRSDGRLDRQFSGDGLVALGRRAGWIAMKVRPAPDGTLRLLTARDSGQGEQHGVVALSARGELPRARFGDGGFVHVGTSPSSSADDPGSAFDIAVDGDGATLVATEGGLRLVTEGGEIDARFGGEGFASRVGGERLVATQAVRLDEAGRIVVLGSDAAGRRAVWRCDASGFVDETFADGGGAEFLRALPTDAGVPYSFLMDVDATSGACALAAPIERTVLSGPPVSRGRFAGAFDLAAPSALETIALEDELPVASGPRLTSVVDVVLAPGGRSMLVVGQARDPSPEVRPRPLLQRVTRDGAIVLPRTNLRIAFDVPPSLEFDEGLSRWFLVTRVRVDTTEPVAARGVRISLYISDDGVVDGTGEREYGRTTFPPVGASASVVHTFRLDPLGAQHGPTVMAGKRIVAQVDGDDRLLETDEADNTAVSAAFE